jgi:acyl carrier protein
MTDKDIFQLIKKSLKTKSKVDINSTSKNIQEWDSIGHLIFLSKLDEKFKGETAKIINIATATSTKKIINILKKNKLIK